MKRGKFFFFLLPAIFLFALPKSVFAESIDLTPTADSFVNDVYPEQNQGSAHSLVTSHDSAFRWSLVRFDLASVPANSIIDSTTLKLYLHETSGDASVPMMTSRILADWSETGVKWTNRPMFDESTGVSVNIDTATGYKSWEITNFVKGWIKGDFSNYGVAIGYGGGNFARSFRSREYGSNKPILTINYHLPEPTPTPSPTPTLTPTPTPKPKATPTLTPTPEEEITPTPEETPIPTPEEKAGLILGIFTRGQAIIAGLILLALIGAGVAFVTYSRKPTKRPEEKEEKPKEEE